MPRHLLLHFRPDGDGGSGDGGGTGESQEDKDRREAQEAEERRRHSGSGGSTTDMVPRSEAQEARSEAKNLRDRLRAAEKERDELKASQETDAEKLKRERDEAATGRTAAETRVRNLQVQVLASKVGIVDPEAAATLLDWSKIEDPEVTSQVEKALRDLVKDKPYLAGKVPGGSDGGAGDGSGASGEDMNSLIRSGFGVRSPG